MEEKKDYREEFRELTFILLGIALSNTKKVVDNINKVLSLEGIVEVTHNKMSVISTLELENIFKFFVEDLKKFKGITFSYKELIMLCLNIKTDILSTSLLIAKGIDMGKDLESIKKDMKGDK